MVLELFWQCGIITVPTVWYYNCSDSVVLELFRQCGIRTVPTVWYFFVFHWHPHSTLKTVFISEQWKPLIKLTFHNLFGSKAHYPSWNRNLVRADDKLHISYRSRASNYSELLINNGLRLSADIQHTPPSEERAFLKGKNNKF